MDLVSLVWYLRNKVDLVSLGLVLKEQSVLSTFALQRCFNACTEVFMVQSVLFYGETGKGAINMIPNSFELGGFIDL